VNNHIPLSYSLQGVQLDEFFDWLRINIEESTETSYKDCIIIVRQDKHEARFRTCQEATGLLRGEVWSRTRRSPID